MKNVGGSLKHVFAVLLFCFVMSMAMVCLADEQGTVAVESAKIREKADASSNQLGSVARGGTVDIIGETTGTDGKVWYQVYVDANTKGYIRSDLITKTGSSSGTSSASGTTATDGQTTTVTDIETKTGTVVTNSVNVRKSASTDSSVVATVSKGVTLTVSGQTTGTDGKNWYKVSFKYNNKDVEGFIRADLVTFENVVNESAVSEITGEENTEGQTEPETETETEDAKQQESDSSSDDESAGIILMNVEEVPYIMPGFELVSLAWNDQKINAYRNGTFFIFYAQKQNGEEGWYIFDKDNNVYLRYPYTTEGVTIPESGSLKENLIPMIVLVIIIVIMAAVIGLLLLKLKGSGDGYEEYEDDDYSDEDDDIEDIEELEDEPDEEPAPQPVRRPAPKSVGQQPVRRSAPQSGASQGQRPAPQSGAQPTRRTAPPQGGQQPVRRPAPQSEAPQGQGGQQPVRRPAPQGGQQPVRRPAPQNGAPQGQRRSNPQNNRPAKNVQPQKGQKAKNFLESEDDDMDFIDI